MLLAVVLTFSRSTAFMKFEGDGAQLLLPKVIYLAIHMAGIMAGIYKCNTLGLVPNKAADWLVHEGINPVSLANIWSCCDVFVHL